MTIGGLVVTLRGTPAQISFLDTATFAVQIVNIPGHTTTGHHWLSANSKFTFVAVENPAGLAVVDNETGAVVADYPYPNPPGGTRAHGVFYQPRGLSGDRRGSRIERDCTILGCYHDPDQMAMMRDLWPTGKTRRCNKVVNSCRRKRLSLLPVV